MFKRGTALVLIVVTLILSVSTASAFSLSDLFSKLTGKVTYDSPSLNNGLIAYYKFDDNLIDSSGKGVNGAVGGTAKYVSGKFGNAIDFNGINQYVTFPNSNSPKLGNNHTISGWIYIKNNVIPTAVISKWCGLCYSGVYNARSYAVGITNGKLEYALSTATGQLNGAFHSFPSNSVLPVNQWVFFAVTYNGTRRTTYINGVEDNHVDRPGDVYQSNADVEIGATHDSGYRSFFNGSLDDLRFYDRTLSASEVQQLYSATSSSCTENWVCGSWSTCSNSQQTRTCTDSNSCGTTNSKPAIMQNCTILPDNITNGLVAYYNFDDNSSSTNIFDSSGNGIIGAVSGGINYVTGKFGQAAYFPGGSYYETNKGYVQTTTNIFPIGSNPISISGWFKYTNGAARSCAVSISQGNHPNGAVALCYYSNQMEILHWGGTNDWISLSSLSPNTWYHMTYTADGTNEKVYLNGVLSASKAQTYSLSNSIVRLGTWYEGIGNYWWWGSIDEVKIYNRTLSASEVGLLYNSVPTIPQNITTNLTTNITINATTNITTNLTTNITINATTNITTNLTTNLVPIIQVECPIYSPIICENGVIVSKGIDANGCALPLVCVVGEDLSIINNPNNNCKGCMYDNTCMPIGYRIIVEDKPSFCDISGIREQKKNKENLTQTCQNSFECESNLCSAGECVEIIGSKAVLVKIICKLSHLNDEGKYLSCLERYIYGVDSALNQEQTSENPANSGQAVQSCVPNWNCGIWSTCNQSNNRDRICYDANNCGTNEGKPQISETCGATNSESTTPEITEVTTTQKDFAWWNPSTWTGVTNT
jgi:hypothetical protein